MIQKEDVLVGDFRVTVLGENGQYIFEWESEEEENIVSFDDAQSDISELPDEVISAVEANGLVIKGYSDQGNGIAGGSDNKTQDSNEELLFGDEEPFENTDEKETGEDTEPSSDTISYVVQVDSVENEDIILENIREKFGESIESKIKFSGPYKITYRVYESGEIELDSVDDLGIGTTIS